MKEKYRPRLQEDFNKYCKQIGISQSELPRLVTDRKTMDELKQTFKDKGRGRSTSNNYGICYWEDRTIYVNTNVRNHWGRMYSHVKYTSRQASKHKATYTDILHTLVHELVHYRFKYLQHGAKFEERIREILRGKVFPEKQIDTENNIQSDNKSVTSAPTPTPVLELVQEQEPIREVYENTNDKLTRLRNKIRAYRRT